MKFVRSLLLSVAVVGVLSQLSVSSVSSTHVSVNVEVEGGNHHGRHGHHGHHGGHHMMEMEHPEFLELDHGEHGEYSVDDATSSPTPSPTPAPSSASSIKIRTVSMALQSFVDVLSMVSSVMGSSSPLQLDVGDLGNSIAQLMDDFKPVVGDFKVVKDSNGQVDEAATIQNFLTAAKTAMADTTTFTANAQKLADQSQVIYQHVKQLAAQIKAPNGLGTKFINWIKQAENDIFSIFKKNYHSARKTYNARRYGDASSSTPSSTSPSTPASPTFNNADAEKVHEVSATLQSFVDVLNMIETTMGKSGTSFDIGPFGDSVAQLMDDFKPIVGDFKVVKDSTGKVDEAATVQNFLTAAETAMQDSTTFAANAEKVYDQSKPLIAKIQSLGKSVKAAQQLSKSAISWISKLFHHGK